LCSVHDRSNVAQCRAACALCAVRNSPAPRAFGGRPRRAGAVVPPRTPPRTPGARRRMEPPGAHKVFAPVCAQTRWITGDCILRLCSARSAGERRSCPRRLQISYSIKTVAARTTRIAPANLTSGAILRRSIKSTYHHQPCLPCARTQVLIVFACIAVAVYAFSLRLPHSPGERRRRPLHMCN